MLKIEKHKEEIEKIDIRRKSIDCYLAQLSNTYKPGCCNDIGCSTCLKNSLLELMKEYKKPIKLTTLEFELLKHEKRVGNKFVACDKDGEIIFSKNKPYKKEVIWDVKTYSFCGVYLDGLFTFVKWEDKEPYLIEEILSNCEVVEDE